MAALIAAKRSITLSKPFQNLSSSPARPLAAIARSFNTNDQTNRRSGAGAVSRRRSDCFSDYVSDMTMSQLFFDGPFPSAARGAGDLQVGRRKGGDEEWRVKGCSTEGVKQEERNDAFIGNIE